MLLLGERQQKFELVDQSWSPLLRGICILLRVLRISGALRQLPAVAPRG
jgi:hypothetical protein